MASADFSEDSEEKRPTVQVGDPFTEKLLIEACLELMASDAIVAIQDMGAAGLTSSSVEMASKGGVGIELDMNAVPCREEGMTPYEMMLSESQERMLMVLKPGREAEAEAIFRKWELDFAVIGRVTDTGHMVLKWNGEIAADIPLAPLADEAPLLRPALGPAPSRRRRSPTFPNATDIAADLLKLMASPDLASRRWIWEQYDQKVGADTRPAARRRRGAGPGPRHEKGAGDHHRLHPALLPGRPHRGRQAGDRRGVSQPLRGRRPPARRHRLPQFRQPAAPRDHGPVGRLHRGDGRGLPARSTSRSSRATSRSTTRPRPRTASASAILPTPAIGGVGLIEDWRKAVGIAFKGVGDVIVTIGDRHGHLGQSLWLREIHGREDGPPPPVDLLAEHAAGTFVRAAIAGGAITACHDVSDGGLAVALAEMALAGDIGALINGPAPFGHAGYFAEDQGLYVATIADDCLLTFLTRAYAAGVEVEAIGRTKGSRLIFELPDGDHAVRLADLRARA